MAQAGWRELFTGSYAARSIAIAGATIIHAVNIFIATTVMPSVVEDIGGIRFFSWATTLFVVASIIGASLAASTIDRLGTRNAYRFALLFFGIGALICSLAPAMAVLLVGRSVQGLGGGMLSALTYTTIRLVFPERLWARAMAVSSAMWGIATLSGPAIGGIFAELGVWRLAFGSIIPLVVGLALLLERILPRTGASEERRESRVPWVQLGILAASVLIVSAASAQDDTLVTGIGIVVAISLFFVLVRVERRAATRLLPTGTFSLRSPIGPIFATMVLMSFAITADIFIPLFLQVLHGLSPLWAGYLTAVLSIGWTLASLPVSGLAGPQAARAILTGQTMMVVGMVTLAVVMPVHGDSVGLIAVIAAGLLLLGMGMGSGWAHVLTRALAAAPEGEQAITAQSLTTVQMLASAFGAAFAGVVTNLAGLSDAGNPDGTANAALWLFAIFAVIPVLALLMFLYSLRQTRRRPATAAESVVREAQRV